MADFDFNTIALLEIEKELINNVNRKLFTWAINVPI